jgi:hypothetical protein
MFAGWGRPDGDLGVESITLQLGQFKAFLTDWKYERQRSDGTTYYGSHLRRARNAGTMLVQLKVRDPWRTTTDRINPGDTRTYQADLMEVTCLTR